MHLQSVTASVVTPAGRTLKIDELRSPRLPQRLATALRDGAVLGAIALVVCGCGEVADRIEPLAVDPSESQTAEALGDFFSQDDFFQSGSIGRTYVLAVAQVNLPGYFRTNDVVYPRDPANPERSRSVDSRGRTISRVYWDAERIERIEYWADSGWLRAVMATGAQEVDRRAWVWPPGIGLAVVLREDGHMVLGFQNKPRQLLGFPAGRIESAGERHRMHAIGGKTVEEAISAFEVQPADTIELTFAGFVNEVYATEAILVLASGSDTARLLVSELTDGGVIIWSGIPAG